MVYNTDARLQLRHSVVLPHASMFYKRTWVSCSEHTMRVSAYWHEKRLHKINPFMKMGNMIISIPFARTNNYQVLFLNYIIRFAAIHFEDH